MLTESTCRNCGEHIIILGPVPGDPTVDGWYHYATRSELCGAVNDADDDRVAEPGKVGACVDCGAPVINGESLSGPLDPDGVVHTCGVEMTDTDWAWLNTVEG